MVAKAGCSGGEMGREGGPNTLLIYLKFLMGIIHE
jgi:hypothetical protein